MDFGKFPGVDWGSGALALVFGYLIASIAQKGLPPRDSFLQVMRHLIDQVRRRQVDRQGVTFWIGAMLLIAGFVLSILLIVSGPLQQVILRSMLFVALILSMSAAVFLPTRLTESRLTCLGFFLSVTGFATQFLPPMLDILNISIR